MATRDRGTPSSHAGDGGKERDTAGPEPQGGPGRRARRTTSAEPERAAAAIPKTAPPVPETAAPERPEPPPAGEGAPEDMPRAGAREERRDRHRTAHANALGLLIEQQFADPGSPCHSYSDLERRSRISREALSRYVTSRADRRRSPTIDTLVAIADALHVSLEGVARAAAASVRGIVPPPEDVQHMREEALSSLVAGLSDAQFNAVVELLRQLGPWRGGAS